MRPVAVTELVFNFAEACRTLVPLMERARVPWRDGEQYDNWDRVAEALFESLVIEPCLFQAAHEGASAKLSVAPYGFEPAADEHAYVVVDLKPEAQMTGLSTITGPFDHVRCADRRMIALADAEFAFVFKKQNGSVGRLRTVDLDAA